MDGLFAVAIATADFNGDGKADLAEFLNNCIDGNCRSGSLSIALGDGNGSFQPPTDYPIGISPEAVVVGDLNGDGHPDIVVSSASSDYVTVFIDKADGTFEPGVNYRTRPHSLPNGIVLGDVNADGKLDVVVAEGGDSAISIFLGKGDGTLGTATKVTATGTPTAIAAGDFNRDGKLDLALTTIPSPDTEPAW